MPKPKTTHPSDRKLYEVAKETQLFAKHALANLPKRAFMARDYIEQILVIHSDLVATLEPPPTPK